VATRPFVVAVLGATGAVGREILEVLGERRFPLAELRAFASTDGGMPSVEFRGEEIAVEAISEARVAGADVVFCAAPGALAPLLPALAAAGARLVDLSGELELDPSVPLALPGQAPAPARPWLAVPRGVVSGLACVLVPLHREGGLERVTVVSLESALGAGREGPDELLAGSIELLGGMSGDLEASTVFPSPLAFDCLPLVGDLLEGGDSSEERRLGHVLRRALAAPALAVECTRVRVPIFTGSLACVHVVLARDLAPERARDLLAKEPAVEVLAGDELPTPRGAAGRDRVRLGRLRGGPGARLAFVLAQDDLRRGAAVVAVEAAETLTRTAPTPA
jgi:aspartate-semialdehyde dehydrogenase